MTTAELRRTLLKSELLPFTEAEFHDDTPLVLDSLLLVWLAQVLEERHGIELDLHDPAWGEGTTVRELHARVRAMAETGRRP